MEFGEGVSAKRDGGGLISINISKSESSPLECKLTYATINGMREQLSKPVHESYRKHRKDFTWKILFPVILSVVLCIGLIVLISIATFNWGGDVQRWADISTMWIAIPFMVEMLIFGAIVVGIVYLLAKLLKITPRYTVIVQDFMYKIEGYVKRGADAVAKPFISMDSIGAAIRRLFGQQ